MDLNGRLARFDAALLRVRGRIGQSNIERASMAELQEVLAELDVLIKAHGADLSAREARHLQQVHRDMTRQIADYDAPPSVRQRMLRAWNSIQPMLRRAAAVRTSD